MEKTGGGAQSMYFNIRVNQQQHHQNGMRKNVKTQIKKEGYHLQNSVTKK